MDRREMETVVYEKDGPVARIVMNMPQKANIQTAQQVWDFEDCLKWADRDDEVKVLVIKSVGKGFCAGHVVADQDQMREMYPLTGPSPERTWRNHDIGHFLWPPLRIWEFPKPTISQVHGYCVGGGTVYAWLTDLTIASDDSYFQMPLLQGLGLPHAQTAIEPWVFMNWKHAYEYLYTAKTLDAHEAKRLGAVNQVVPRAELEARVEEIAATIAQAPLTTLLAAKASIKRAWELMGMRVHMQSTTDLVNLCAGASDVREFIARRDGRKPRQMAAAVAAERDRPQP